MCIIGLLLIAAVCRVVAAKTPALRVLGTQSISSERAVSILKAGGFPADKSLRDLQEEYLKNGRLFASMNVRVESDSSYTVVVDEGAEAHVRRMHVAGASHLTSADVTRELGLEPGSP